jgi:hypothetical protein
MMMPRPQKFSRGTTQREVSLAAAYHMGRRVALREVADAIAERDRSIAQLRDELARDVGELRALLNAAVEEWAYLQRLDAAARASERGPLH